MSGTGTLITGASLGLGLAFLRAHPEALGCGLHDAPEDVADRFIKLDLARSDPARIIDLYRARTGVLWPRVLINNAGVNELTWIKDITQGNIEDHFSVNLNAPILLMSEVARLVDQHSKLLDEGECARIINVGSISGWTPQRCSLLYGATKAALHMATRSAARELAPKIVVMAMAPGCIEDTHMTENVRTQVCDQRGWTRSEARAYDMVYQPMGRYSNTDEMLKVLTFLAYEAPPYMTGSIVPVPGGGA